MKPFSSAKESTYKILFFALIAIIFNFKDIGAQSISFGASGLIGESVINPTSLEFGPDGRLYVSQQNGVIWAYTIERDLAPAGNGAFTVINTEEITLVKNGIPNHNDSGVFNPVQLRQVTGIKTAGTPSNPILYVTSSDYLIAGGSGGNDSNLDTNSSVISKLEWTGSAWEKIDLIRGLPRCEENHAINGLEMFEDSGNTYLFVAQGGNTNKGAPSNNFAVTPEYFYTGAILKVNLTQLESMPVYTDPRSNTQYIYDLPTLNDPSRIDIDNSHPEFPYGVGHPLYTATIDLGDPFGGNNSLNQAFPEAGSPIEIFSHGYRNPYDVLVTETGKIYTSDNGPNSGWGGIPKLYRKSDDFYLLNQFENGGYDPINHYVTNEINEEGSSNLEDPLHYIGEITDPNDTYYGGHPNPINAFPSRARILSYVNNGTSWEITNIGPGEDDFATLISGVSGYFQSSFDITDFPENPKLGEYLLDDPFGSSELNVLDIRNTSTNGIAEYTASNFEGAMQGNILTASFGGDINRYVLNGAGDGLIESEAIFSGFGSIPLDVIAQGDADIFPGTIWSATYGQNNITVFEPSDINCPEPGDSDYDEFADYDMDGYTNKDEIDNGKNICSQGSKPDDNDGDLVSDLNDDDDDNDGVLDVNDVFALDPNNGLSTNLPANFPFWNNDPGTGFLGLGFTGLMLDPSGATDYLTQYSLDDLSFGGAAGKATVDNVTGGDALNNNQDNGFQLGVNVDSNSNPFTIHGKVESPFFAINGSPTQPVDFQSYGISCGNGDQDNYLKVVVMNGTSGGGSLNGIQVLLESGGSILEDSKYDITDILNANAISLYISIDPSLNQAQPFYSLDDGFSLNLLGSPITLPASFLDEFDDIGLAISLISTSRSSTTPNEFTATWDYIEVYENQNGVLSISPDLVDFGLTPLNNSLRTKYVTIKNEGGPTDNIITINSGGINFTGTDAALFSSPISLPLDIYPGSSISIPIDFASSVMTVGEKTANLEITHTGNNSPVTSIVKGELTDAFVPIARVNAGGEFYVASDGGPDWEDNSVGGNTTGESYVVSSGSPYPSSGIPVNPGSLWRYDDRDSSIPSYIDEDTYLNVFGILRSIKFNAADPMIFSFGIPNGDYIVNLYIGNLFGGSSEPNERILGVKIEDELLIDQLDPSAVYGHRTVGMIQRNISVTDGSIELEWVPILDGPIINAIEILGLQFPIIEIDAIADKINVVNDLSDDLSIAASGGNPVDNFTYVISGQPDGILIEPTNGLVSGTIQASALTGGPNNNGIHDVTVTVSKPGSLDVEQQFTWTIKEAFDLDLTVSLQGRSDYSGIYSVVFYRTSDLATPAYSFSETADASGLISLSTPIAEGEYKLLVKHPMYLQKLKTFSLIGNQTETIPELLAGDVNDDNKINISDFGIFAGTYNLESGNIGYDSRADFNVSLKVDISDFGLLAGNYNIFGDTEND